MQSIKFSSQQNRMFSFADNHGAYLMFHSSNPKLTDGVKKGDKTFIKDFYILKNNKCYTRYSDCRTTVNLDSAEIYFKKTKTLLKIALVKNAFYVKVLKKGSGDYFALVSDDKEMENSAFELSNGAEYYFDFSDEEHETFEEFSERFWARLSKSTFKTNSELYNQALSFSHANGFTFVNDIDGWEGIWAGLPWFRDNWGRDTFIALPGILLVTGQYDKAKKVIQGFLKFQCKDKNSPVYGRIPNRYTTTETIYNTADGGYWLIREIYEYCCYTGDKDFLKEVWPAVQLVLESDLELRVDKDYFVLHKDADSWMDARINGLKSWSPRGTRANDIQVLWWQSLVCGSKIAEILGYEEESQKYRNIAEIVSKNFVEKFWDKENQKLADRIDAKDKPDYSVRMNQLFAVTIPFAEKPLLEKSIAQKITQNACGELLFPWGICSLSQHEWNFHPYHDNCDKYHKDAAYHNGTIWGWNAGPAIGALCDNCYQELAFELTGNLSWQLLNLDCAGTMSENLSAYLDKDGKIHPSGTWSQAWSVSEFNRVFWQYYCGINPRLMENKIIINPKMPSALKKGYACQTFGTGQNQIVLELKWTKKNFYIKFTSPSAEDIDVELLGNSDPITLYRGQTLKFCRIYSLPSEPLEFSHPLSQEAQGEFGCLKEENFLEKIIQSDSDILAESFV